jgi:hypothetical protein
VNAARFRALERHFSEGEQKRCTVDSTGKEANPHVSKVEGVTHISWNRGKPLPGLLLSCSPLWTEDPDGIGLETATLLGVPGAGQTSRP